MSKKKKNSNYVTEKTEEAKASREEAAKKKSRDKIVKRVLTLGVAFIVAVAILVGGAFALGLFDYYPTATYHAAIELEDYGTLHVELYGNDAPLAVENFVKLADQGYFDGLKLHSIKNGLLYGGAISADGGTKGIGGEFSSNGKENKISHRRGIISMARGEDPDSAYAQFFIVNEDNASLDGDYAAFAKITSGMDIIDRILKESSVDANGRISSSDAPVIKSITTHESH